MFSLSNAGQGHEDSHHDPFDSAHKNAHEIVFGRLSLVLFCYHMFCFLLTKAPVFTHS